MRNFRTTEFRSGTCDSQISPSAYVDKTATPEAVQQRAREAADTIKQQRDKASRTRKSGP